MASSRAGGAVRTGPRGPRPFSRFRICLSGNPAPPQDGVGPGAQAAPGTAPVTKPRDRRCQPPPQGSPGRGSEPLTPGACGLYHWLLIRGDAGSEGLNRCARPGSEGDPRLWEEQRAAITRRDHLSQRGPSLRGEASLASSGSFPFQDSRKPRPPCLVGRSVCASAEWARRCMRVGTAWPAPKGGPLVAAMVLSSGRVKASYPARRCQAVPRPNGGERGGEQ